VSLTLLVVVVGALLLPGALAGLLILLLGDRDGGDRP
jgi:hypothetical protein